MTRNQVKRPSTTRHPHMSSAPATLQRASEPARSLHLDRSQPPRRIQLHHSLAVAGLALLFAPWAATAQPGAGPVAGSEGFPPGLGNPWERVSERYDANGDGVVTEAEFLGADDRFARMDQDRDGQLTEADFEGRSFGKAAGTGALGPLVRVIDTDRSRDVSAEEWQSFLASLDADGDGLVTSEELQAHREARREQRGLASSTNRPAPRARRAFEALADHDGDGQLEVSDLQAIFDQLDQDGDGALATSELPRRGHRVRALGKNGRGGFDRGQALGEADSTRVGDHLLRRADADRDSELTREQWLTFVAELDQNGDGSVDLDELRRPAPEGAPTFDSAEIAAAFDRADADGNGVISDDEWPRRRGPRHGPRRGR